MAAKPVSHAERLKKRHARVAAAARPVVTPAPAPGPISERSRPVDHLTEVAPVGDGPRGKPGVTTEANADETNRPNPFAGFMGCAP